MNDILGILLIPLSLALTLLPLLILLSPRFFSIKFGYSTKSDGFSRFIRWIFWDFLINILIIVPIIYLGLSMGDGDPIPFSSQFPIFLAMILVTLLVFLFIDVLFMYLGVWLKHRKNINEEIYSIKVDINLPNASQPIKQNSNTPSSGAPNSKP